MFRWTRTREWKIKRGWQKTKERTRKLQICSLMRSTESSVQSKQRTSVAVTTPTLRKSLWWFANKPPAGYDPCRAFDPWWEVDLNREQVEQVRMDGLKTERMNERTMVRQLVDPMQNNNNDNRYIINNIDLIISFNVNCWTTFILK